MRAIDDYIGFEFVYIFWTINNKPNQLFLRNKLNQLKNSLILGLKINLLKLIY